jgi:hypothetical protein
MQYALDTTNHTVANISGFSEMQQTKRSLRLNFPRYITEKLNSVICIGIFSYR